jgi:hypothetical protein
MKLSESSTVSTDFLEENILPCLEQTGRSSMLDSLDDHYQQMDLQMRLSEIEHGECFDSSTHSRCSNKLSFLLFACKKFNQDYFFQNKVPG